MATSFFATKISTNLARTPEGFLLARGVVIARTGFQRYEVSELPQDRAAELGIDLRGGGHVDLYRPPESVFAVSTIASAEGKPITLTHPPKFVGPDNSREYVRGHIQHVRKGEEALDSGDWPLIADLMIMDADAINAVDAGTREISLGYEYDLQRSGDQLIQANIVVNHCAIVRNGRAGPEARINDEAPQVTPTLVPQDFDYIEPMKSDQEGRKQINKGEYNMSKILDRIFGLGLKQLATDEKLDPAQFTEAARAVHRATDSEEESEEERKKKEKESEDRKAKDAAEEEERKKESDRKAKDAEMEGLKKRATDAEAEVEKLKKEGEDRKAKDAESKAEEHFKPCSVKDCAARDCRMHDALGGILEKHPEAENADVQELGKLLQEFMGEEAQEPEHQDAEVGSEVIEPIQEDEEMVSEGDK